MDESYLTGEPYVVSKTPGSGVLSGAVNGEFALTIRAEKLARDSRYAKIMQVMQESAQRRPRLRRLGDQLSTQTDFAKLVDYIVQASKEMSTALDELRGKKAKRPPS